MNDMISGLSVDEATKLARLQQDIEQLKRELDFGVRMLEAKATALTYAQEAIRLRLGIEGPFSVNPDGAIKLGA